MVATMTDREVLDKIEQAKRVRARLIRRAERQRYVATCFEWSRWAGRRATELDQAARQEALDEIDRVCAEQVLKARAAYRTRIEALREAAGQWADLVPST